MPLSCRFYANQFPDVEDTVMVNVRQIAEMGAYVSLLEYNNKGLNFRDSLLSYLARDFSNFYYLRLLHPNLILLNTYNLH